MKSTIAGLARALLVLQLAYAGVAIAAVSPETPHDFSDYEVFSVASDITEPKVIEEARPKISLPLPEKESTFTVLVFELFIDAEGRVNGVYVHRGLEWGLTPEYAASMFHWVFEPATKNGEPVAVRYVITVKR